jgi:hypothetical protein
MVDADSAYPHGEAGGKGVDIVSGANSERHSDRVGIVIAGRIIVFRIPGGF